MTDATGTSEWVFNLLGQVTELTTPQGEFEYTYNTYGQPYQMEDSSGTWTTLYDTYHRAYGMTNPWSETTTVAFDSAGRAWKKTLPNGMYETYHFDERSRVEHVKTTPRAGGWVKKTNLDVCRCCAARSLLCDGVTFPAEQKCVGHRERHWVVRSKGAQTV